MELVWTKDEQSRGRDEVVKACLLWTWFHWKEPLWSPAWVLPHWPHQGIRATPEGSVSLLYVNIFASF